MRFKLTLEVLPEKYGRDIPINYQYEMSAAIYRILSSANEEYSSWLHENGFVCEDGDKLKRFKLFTYSRLTNGKFEPNFDSERLRIKSNFVDWYISFLPEKSTEKFIQGLFKRREFELGDKISAVKFMVRDVVMMPSLEYKGEMDFVTMSPICLRKKIDDGRVEYMSPKDENAPSAIFAGITSRYNAFYGHEYENNNDDFEIILLDEPKSKLIKIKAGTPAETLVKGYNCRFHVKASVELIKIMYESGVGEECSQGFGCIKEINNN